MTIYGPKPIYSNDPYYARLLSKYRKQLSAPRDFTEHLFSASSQLRFLDKLEGIFNSLLVTFFLISVVGLIAVINVRDLKGTGVLLIGVPAFGGLIFFILMQLTVHKQENARNRLFETAKWQIQELENLALDANNAMLKEWTAYNESFSGYPPDWDERSSLVKSRDDWKCTECGWPDGFQRMTRNLHAHHVVPLSKGGDNHLSNLVTLCHRCHSKIHDGAKFTFYKPKKKRSKFHRWH